MASKPRWSAKAARWHLDRKPIHAGAAVQIQGWRVPDDPVRRERGELDPGEWFDARLESREQGRELDAYVYVHGIEFRKHVAGFGFAAHRTKPVPWSATTMRWPPQR